MVAYDLAYVAFVAVMDRSLAPRAGARRAARVAALRAEGAAARRPIHLERPRGIRAGVGANDARGPTEGRP